MRIYKGLNRLQSSSLFAYVFCSAFTVIAEILMLAGNNLQGNIAQLLGSFSQLLFVLTGYVFCYFVTLQLTDGKHAFKAFWSVLCFAVFNTAFGALHSGNTPYFFGIVTALFCSFCFNRLDKVLSLSLTAVFAVLSGVLVGFISDYWDSFIMYIAEFISGKGFLSSMIFSVLDNIFSLFGFSGFEDMFFYKSYGGSVVYGGEIVTGVKDLFKAGYNGILVSQYLSGHYYLIFALFGISLALFYNLKGAQKYVLALTAAGALISGNIGFLLLFLFLESPFLFIAVLIIGALSYFTASLIDLGVGYSLNGGIIEMILNFDNPVYLLAGGVVFVAIGYFVYRFVYEKHGISDSLNIYIPERLNSFVKALGGINNIVRYKDSSIEVRNPKLIDTVSVDCEINENIVTSRDERLTELKDYL